MISDFLFRIPRTRKFSCYVVSFSEDMPILCYAVYFSGDIQHGLSVGQVKRARRQNRRDVNGTGPTGRPLCITDVAVLDTFPNDLVRNSKEAERQSAIPKIAQAWH